MRSPEAIRADHRLALATGAAIAVTLLALFWPAAEGRVFVYLDLGKFFLPMRLFLAQSLERGNTPLWMPNLFCGYYAHGEGQIGMFHPLRWLLYRFLPFTAAFDLECLLPFLLALVGAALFLRRLELPTAAALFGGATFAFSAYMALRLTHLNALQVHAHVGWLLYAIDVALGEPSRARRTIAWVAVALLLGSQLLVGYPTAIVYCWLVVFPYWLFVAITRRQLRSAAALVGALSVGLLLGAIQWVPSYDFLMTSQRITATYEFLTWMSLHPLNLLSIVGPWLFRNHLYMEMGADQMEFDPLERSLYFGAVVPIAALWILLRWRELGARRPLVGLLAIGSALALVLAFGRFNPLYRYFLELPLVGMMRVPARYSIVLFFAGAVFAALAFADLQRGGLSAHATRRAAWVWLVPALGWVVAAVAWAVREPMSPDVPIGVQLQFAAKQINEPHWIALGPILSTLAAALFTAAVHGRRAALLGLVALGLADQASYAATLWWFDPPVTLAAYRASIPKPPATPPYRVVSPMAFGTFSGEGPGNWWTATQLLVHDARLAWGYTGMIPASRLDYTNPASQRVAGVVARIADDRFEPVEGALPRARLVARAVVSTDLAAAFARVDVATTALVEEAVAIETGPPGDAAIDRDDPGDVAISTRSATRQLLVLSERYHSGWRAEVDGREARVERVYGDFMGCVVDAGEHHVRFRFAPQSFALGRSLSLAGIGAAAIAAWVGFGRRRQ